jgi:hypothetical protein
LALVLMASSAVRPARADAIADWYVVTQELVRDHLPEAASLRDLG